MAKIKNNDFIELDYTGKVKENGFVFDTTLKELAKTEGMDSQNMEYGPITICVGQNHLIPGLDSKIIGKEPGKHTIDLSPEEAFGKKDAKLIRMVPISKFKNENIRPVPGLQINADGHMGLVKTVSGGRVMVDFNHPLAGKDITYEIDIKNIVENPEDKLRSMLKLSLGMPDPKIKISENKAEVSVKQDIPPAIAESVSEKIKEIIGLESVSFKKEEKDKPVKKD